MSKLIVLLVLVASVFCRYHNFDKIEEDLDRLERDVRRTGGGKAIDGGDWSSDTPSEEGGNILGASSTSEDDASASPDAGCDAVSGTCITTSTCSGSFKSGLCSGASNRRCCAPDAVTLQYNNYKRMLANGVSLDSSYSRQVTEAVNDIKANNNKKFQMADAVAKIVDLPVELVLGIWYREASLLPDRYLHNGDRLGRPTVNVPKGKFFTQWQPAAIDALNEKKSLQSRVPDLHYGGKDLASMAVYAEFYNGLGYYNKNRVSPYAMAGTTFYKGGLYVRDGVFSATTKDSRPGVVGIIQGLFNAGL